MGWTTHSLKLPDEGHWIALVEVSEDGKAVTMGYIEPTTLEQLVNSMADLTQVWQSHMNS